VCRVRNPNGAQLSRPMELRQRDGIPTVGLDPVAGALRDQRRRDHQERACVDGPSDARASKRILTGGSIASMCPAC
jgi:hypothetical protein